MALFFIPYIIDEHWPFSYCNPTRRSCVVTAMPNPDKQEIQNKFKIRIHRSSNSWVVEWGIFVFNSVLRNYSIFRGKIKGLRLNSLFGVYPWPRPDFPRVVLWSGPPKLCNVNALCRASRTRAGRKGFIPELLRRYSPSLARLDFQTYGVSNFRTINIV